MEFDSSGNMSPTTDISPHVKRPGVFSPDSQSAAKRTKPSGILGLQSTITDLRDQLIEGERREMALSEMVAALKAQLEGQALQNQARIDAPHIPSLGTAAESARTLPTGNARNMEIEQHERDKREKEREEERQRREDALGERAAMLAKREQEMVAREDLYQKNLLAAQKQISKIEDNLKVEEEGEISTHGRASCSLRPFTRPVFDEAVQGNKIACPGCLCEICNVECDRCPYWNAARPHSSANPDDPMVQFIKSQGEVIIALHAYGNSHKDGTGSWRAVQAVITTARQGILSGSPDPRAFQTEILKIFHNLKYSKAENFYSLVYVTTAYLRLAPSAWFNQNERRYLLEFNDHQQQQTYAVETAYWNSVPVLFLQWKNAIDSFKGPPPMMQACISHIIRLASRLPKCVDSVIGYLQFPGGECPFSSFLPKPIF